MSYWIEHKEGAVLLAMSGGDAPEPQMGGEVAEVDVLCDPAQSLFLDGGIVDFGPRPSFQHAMDPKTRSWVIAVSDQWAQVRAKRDALLTASDWVSLRALEQGVPPPPEWVTYRQALRDLTLQSDPSTVVWPAAPWPMV